VSSANVQTAAETGSLSFSLPDDLENAFHRAARKWDHAGNTNRLWKKDASLWTNTDETNWLGWLNIVDEQLANFSKFKAASAEVREDGFSHMLLLGMGGSSLCPEVFAHTFGRQAGFPELLVLDSTDPVYIRSLRTRIDPARTLFCVSGKSGTTLEPDIFMRYFFDETKKAVGGRAGHHFIAITDPGSELEKISQKLGFRRLFHGIPSIGGRYSALSDFGMIPFAAMGLDVERFLNRAAGMVEKCKSTDSARNPGVSLGLILGTAAAEFGRDKVTLICSRSVYSLGAWLEQLLAESTGKEGRGLIPIDREPLFDLDNYGRDRVFVYIKCISDNDPVTDAAIAALEYAGEPVVRIVLKNRYDLGQAFFQWEIATVVAGSIIRINPFDQPDVEASKIAARKLTAAFEETGSLPFEQPIFEQDGIELFADPANAASLLNGGNTLGAIIRAHVDRLAPGDYFGLLAYIPMFPEYEAKLADIRKHIVESKHVATVLGFGPRFLHSTGQAYKGGQNSGVFLQITCDDAEDLAAPQQKYTFGIVKAAQAREDFETLANRGRRLLRIHLGKDLPQDLERLSDLVCAAVAH